MVGKSHQLVGFTTAYTLALLLPAPPLNTQTIVVSLLCISLGSLTPDLDSQENKIYTIIPIGQRLFAEVGERAFGRHRSISHSVIGVCIIAFASKWLLDKIPPENGLNTDVLWWSYILAVVSHLIADMVTKDGVPLLWPIKWRFGIPPFKFLRMKTGGWIEVFVVRAVLVVWIGYLTYIEWNTFKYILGF